MESIEAVIFDLDGVIVDTAKYHFEAWKRLANKLEIDFPDSIDEQLKGVSRMNALEIILESGNVKYSQEEKEQFAVLKNEWYLDFLKELSKKDILPGINAYLSELKSVGFQIGLASASKNARFILDKVGLNGFFDVIVDGHATKKAKPDPEVFLTCANLLGVKPANCLIIEDAIAGVEAAKRAGMRVIGIGSYSELLNADIVIPSPQPLSIQFVAGRLLHQEA